MIAALLLSLTCASAPPRPCAAKPVAPQVVTITTPRGDTRHTVITVDGAPMLLAGPVAGALGGRLSVQDGWAEVLIATQSYRFLLGAPFLVRLAGTDSLLPLAAPAVARAVPPEPPPPSAPTAADGQCSRRARRATTAAPAPTG